MTIIAKRRLVPTRSKSERNPSDHTYQAVMDMAGTLDQHREIPIRIQRRWVFNLILIIIILATPFAIDLYVISQTGIAGRDIQDLLPQISNHANENADLQDQIAKQLSNESLQARALVSGYKTIAPDQINYITVPGYFPQEHVILQAPTSQQPDIINSPEFTETLSSWITRQLDAASIPLAQEH